MTHAPRHALASLLALLSLAACAPDFAGPEKVRSLRLLAVQAEPPEIGAADDAALGGAGWPAGAAALRSLVGHPDFAAADTATQAVILHLGCTPLPGDPAGTACSQMSELAQPSNLLQALDLGEACAAPGLGKVGAITFSGLEACGRSGCGPVVVRRDPADPSSTVTLPAAGYTLPALLDPAQPAAGPFALGTLPAGHPQRVVGLDVIDLALVVEATPAELAPAAAVPDACTALAAVLQNLKTVWPGRENLASLKWIHVRGPDMPAENPPNRNPTIAGIHYQYTASRQTHAGLLPDLGAAPLVVPDEQKVKLLPDFGGADDETLREQYQRYDTAGKYIDTRRETWAYSWLNTRGAFELPFTDSNDPENTLDAKGDAVVWLVVRDLRGGMAWTAAGIRAER
jgi:hypothetical protein